jgi:hypothetical protein
MGGPGISYNDTVLALDTAKAAGVRVFRFFASLWGPNMAYWIQQPDAYWAEFDKLMSDIESRGMYSIPSIGYSSWYEVANRAYAAEGVNETINDMVKNSTSVSQTLAMRYFKEIASRYASRKGVLLWELGNELNLMVNLPSKSSGVEKNFNTAEMSSYCNKLAALVRTTERVVKATQQSASTLPPRPISSGLSAPRPSSWHMEKCPLNGPCPASIAAGEKGLGFWGIDSKAQWLSMLRAQHAGLEVWSIHHYSNTAECWFDQANEDKQCADGTRGDNVALATVAAAVAKEAGAALFVGEYGGKGPNFTGPSVQDQSFPAAMLDAQVADTSGAFLLSGIWAWMCPSHRKDMVCIYPNSTLPKEAGSNRMVRLLQEANAKLHTQSQEKEEQQANRELGG